MRKFLDERWQEYLGGLHREAVQARSMGFAVLTDRDVLYICKKLGVCVQKPRAAIHKK